MTDTTRRARVWAIAWQVVALAACNEVVLATDEESDGGSAAFTGAGTTGESTRGEPTTAAASTGDGSTGDASTGDASTGEADGTGDASTGASTGGDDCGSDEGCSCPAGTATCDAGPCATDLQTDDAHCGGCGQACAAGQGCVDGGCEVARAVDAGYSHSCALDRRDGGVWCWGLNSEGQLGDGSLDDRAAPVRVEGLAPARALHLGAYFSCAELVSGALACWGSNDEKQLGTAGGDRSTPEPVELAAFVGVGVGWEHACVLHGDGRVSCWGRNNTAQLGVVGASRAAPKFVPGVAGAIGVGSGVQHSCALRDDHKVVCWGGDKNGQLGDGLDDAHGEVSAAPVVVAKLAGVVELAVGDFHNCARLDSEQVWCWGRGERSQLGDDGDKSSHAPIRVDSLPTITALSTGHHTTFAVTADHDVIAWGGNGHGRLGLGSDTFSEPPTVAFADVEAAAGGGPHSCLVTRDGAVRCAGDNSFGQLGDGTLTQRVKFTAVMGLP